MVSAHLLCAGSKPSADSKARVGLRAWQRLRPHASGIASCKLAADGEVRVGLRTGQYPRLATEGYYAERGPEGANPIITCASSISESHSHHI
jgi:hypothetical protein